MPASALPLIAVVTHTSLSHTTGLDSPRPGSAVFHATPLPSATVHVTGVSAPSAMPLASMPRNCGQSRPARGTAARTGAAVPAKAETSAAAGAAAEAGEAHA